MANTRERLIASAVKTVAERGTEGVTTAVLARRAGCSEAMIYKCFEDKEDLIREAFRVLDERVSRIALENFSAIRADGSNFMEVVYSAWHKVYRYLLATPEEALFLIRYRYCSLYTDAVRSERLAYNGTFDKVHEMVESKFGASRATYRGFYINYALEITLSFAERVITGRLKDTQALESVVWKLVSDSIGTFLGLERGDFGKKNDD